MKRKYFFLLAFILTGSAGISFAQTKKIDSLRTLLKTQKEDSGKVKILNALSWKLIPLGQTKEVLNFENEAIVLAKKIHYNKGLATAFHNLAVMYQEQGNYPSALENSFASLKIREKSSDLNGLSSSYLVVGNIYGRQLDFDKALEMYGRVLKISRESGDRKTEAVCFSNMGIIYKQKGDLDKALHLQFQSLGIRQKFGYTRDLANSYSLIANIYMEQKKLDSSLEYNRRALKLSEEVKDRRLIALMTGNTGDIYFLKNDFGKAESFFNKSLILLKEIGYIDHIKEIYKNLSEIDSIKGNYKNALQNYKLHIVYRDSVQNEQNTKKLVQSQMQYDFDKKSAADSIKNSEAKKFDEIKHQQEISRQRTFTYGGIAGFLVMIIVAGISYNAFRNKKKANVEIQRQKHLVEEKQKEILDSIYYARRIQRALITNEKYIERKLNALNR